MHAPWFAPLIGELVGNLVHARDPIDNSPLSCFDAFGKRRTKENEQKKLGLYRRALYNTLM